MRSRESLKVKIEANKLAKKIAVQASKVLREFKTFNINNSDVRKLIEMGTLLMKYVSILEEESKPGGDR